MMELLILIGPKGAGKTHIGQVVERHTDILFLRVEPIWIDFYQRAEPGEKGWQPVIDTIDKAFQNHEKVMIESLGVGEPFEKTLSHFNGKATIRLIRVRASLATCRQRVRTRDTAAHVDVSDDQLEAYNRIVENTGLPCDFIIDNDPPATEEEILASLASILSDTDACRQKG